MHEYDDGRDDAEELGLLLPEHDEQPNAAVSRFLTLPLKPKDQLKRPRKAPLAQPTVEENDKFCRRFEE